MFKKIILKEISTMAVQNYLQPAIALRPVCFASAIDKKSNNQFKTF